MTNDLPYQSYCEQRKEAHQFRRLIPTENLREGKAMRETVLMTNFASNDYLGLSHHPELIAHSCVAAEKYGAGATASRLVCGNNPLYEIIEDKLAKGKGAAAALVMSSGYQVNTTVLAALADSSVVGKPVVVLADRLSHNSLLQGGLLAGAFGDAALIRYQHNDSKHLENLLQQYAAKNAHMIIVTESVFGMDGDCADLTALTALAEKYGAMLYVDEAHATGLYGPDGFGFCAAYRGRIDVAMGTFGKALGSFGAYVACSKNLRDYLVQRCGGLIYSTALPPSTLGAISAALDLVPTFIKERAYLASQAARLREALRAQGWNCGASATHIVPVILGDEEATLKLSELLKQNGMFVPAIRPPTVPRESSRLRISLSAMHKAEEIDRLIAVMGEQAQTLASAA